MKKIICLIISCIVIFSTGCGKNESMSDIAAEQLESSVWEQKIEYISFDRFIGFDKNNLYVTKLEDIWNFYKYDREKNQWTKLPYSFGGDNIILKSAVLDGKLLISKAQLIENAFEFEVLLINDFGESKIIYKNKMITLPDVVLLDKSIAVNYEAFVDGTFYDSLDCIEYKTGKVTNVYSNLFYSNEDNSINGVVTIAIGGTENKLLIEKVELQNEHLEYDKSGITKLYAYDIKTQKEEFVKDLETKAIFLSGMDECILTSDYAYNIPLKNTGTIAKLKNKDFIEYKISGIETAKDILNAYKLNENHIVFNNLEKIYIYDTISMKSETYEYSSVLEEQEYCSDIKVFENKCGYLKDNIDEKSLIFCVIELP